MMQMVSVDSTKRFIPPEETVSLRHRCESLAVKRIPASLL